MVAEIAPEAISELNQAEATAASVEVQTEAVTAEVIETPAEPEEDPVGAVHEVPVEATETIVVDAIQPEHIQAYDIAANNDVAEDSTAQ